MLEDLIPEASYVSDGFVRYSEFPEGVSYRMIGLRGSGEREDHIILSMKLGYGAIRRVVPSSEEMRDFFVGFRAMFVERVEIVGGDIFGRDIVSAYGDRDAILALRGLDEEGPFADNVSSLSGTDLAIWNWDALIPMVLRESYEFAERP